MIVERRTRKSPLYDNINDDNIDGGDWDVVVAGAGPAGALAAFLLARKSLKVLLVEKESFPRDKVCGGCLNAASLSILDTVGLGNICDDLHANHIEALRLTCGGRSAELAIPSGRAVSRRAFDAALVGAAKKTGVIFCDGTVASVLPVHGNITERSIRLRDGSGQVRIVKTKVALAADGLGHPSLSQLSGFNLTTTKDSFIGLGAMIIAPSPMDDENAITMSVGKHGYVGSAIVEGGQLNVAAAVNANALKRLGSGGTIASILADAGVTIDGISSCDWHGTRPLTCNSASVADHRLFLLGDAMGYVEPFTGEGMAWALSSAVALAPMVHRACQEWRNEYIDVWRNHHRFTIARTHRICRRVTSLLRRPLLARSLVALLGCCPQLAGPLVHRIGQPSETPEVLT